MSADRDGTVLCIEVSEATVGDTILRFESGVDKVDFSALGRFTFSDVLVGQSYTLWVEPEGKNVRLKGYTEYQSGTAPQIDILFENTSTLKGTDIIDSVGVLKGQPHTEIYRLLSEKYGIKGLDSVDSGYNDPVFGRTDPSLTGTEENDILVGTGGLTTVDGRGGNDIVVSKNGAICYGRDGDDILISAGGGTNLIGGLGSDKQHSGTEGDIFWYNSAAETVGDEIYGFQSGKDKVKLKFVGCPDGFTLSDVQRDGNNILWVETEEQGVRLKGYTEFQPGTAPQIDILFKGLTELKASDIDGVRAEIREVNYISCMVILIFGIIAPALSNIRSGVTVRIPSWAMIRSIS